MSKSCKTVLITGASSGLGAGMAREFAKRGYNLALCARRTDRLENLRAELILEYDVQVLIQKLDVNNHDQVFSVFDEFVRFFGSIDRVIVNAGIGNGRRIGTGHFSENLKTAETNFVAGLAQCEAAVKIFRDQNSGHLVLISSMSAKRGLPKHLTTYAASKAGLAHLGEGIRAELINTPIQVSTIYPGYIRTELNEGAKKLPFEVDEKRGCGALVYAIEHEYSTASVPRFPWAIVGVLMKILPLSLVARLN